MARKPTLRQRLNRALEDLRVAQMLQNTYKSETEVARTRYEERCQRVASLERELYRAVATNNTAIAKLKTVIENGPESVVTLALRHIVSEMSIHKPNT